MDILKQLPNRFCNRYSALLAICTNFIEHIQSSHPGRSSSMLTSGYHLFPLPICMFGIQLLRNAGINLNGVYFYDRFNHIENNHVHLEVKLFLHSPEMTNLGHFVPLFPINFSPPLFNRQIIMYALYVDPLKSVGMTQAMITMTANLLVPIIRLTILARW